MSENEEIVIMEDPEQEQEEFTIFEESTYTADKFYLHQQTESSNVWTIKHNLDKFPSVSVVDSAKTKVYGNIRYIDRNLLEITFNGSFSGEAYIN